MIKYDYDVAIVSCDDCDKSVRVVSEYTDATWTPPYTRKCKPTSNEIDYAARRNGIQWFRHGQAKRRHGIEGKSRHLCNTCRIRRRDAIRLFRANMTWYDKIKERLKGFFS